MIVIGITGQSGSGKSIAAQVFKDRGIRVVDADKIAREITLPGTKAYKNIKSVFGDEYFNEDGTLNRKKLGNTVFSDNAKLLLLNSITHPEICSIIEKIICEESLKIDAKALVIDAPLLKQVGLDKFCDVIIVVTSTIDNRIDRIIKRDGITLEAARNRAMIQEGEDYYISGATMVFKNDTTIENLKSKISKYADELEL